MKNIDVARSCSTLGYIGFLPAPGTCATLATLPFVWLLGTYSWNMQLLIMALLGILSYLSIAAALSTFAAKDPQQIVLDEVVGTCFAFFLIPFDWKHVLVVVILFRTLDIYKPFPIAWFDRLGGVWGIMLDDIVAGLLTNSLVRVLLWNI